MQNAPDIAKNRVIGVGDLAQTAICRTICACSCSIAGSARRRLAPSKAEIGAPRS